MRRGGEAPRIGAPASSRNDHPRIEIGRASCDNGDMPLSENEQRILRQIQEQLETDERFASAVSSSGLYKHAVRSVRWAAIGVVVSLAFTIFALQVHFLLSFVGFLGMLGCVLVIERQLRAMSKAGLKDVAATLRGTRLNAQAMRNKFTRDAE